uniref:Iron-sulfur cluster assembly 1 homolog, mitochondrial n=1 Tax=Ciona savignyi TaxID=51511 RepID=H2YTC7_CIOSA
MASKGISATVRAVKGRRILPTKQALVLTEAAVTRIKALLLQNPEACALKVGVKQRGCNGMAYTLDFTTKKEKFDEEVLQDGVKVIIDSKAQMSLLGTEMDYVTDKLSSEFVFNNPNIKGTCGCGESFNV